jgi:folate-binding protein YgfZ
MSSPTELQGSVALTHLGVLRAQGADAAKFLHSQLSNDFALLGLSQARLAGYCSAKGRLLASFVAWKEAHDDFLLVCDASVLPATLKRLGMFVLRSQCKLSDASTAVQLVGHVGASAAVFIGDLAVWGRREHDGASVVRLPDVAGLRRCIVASAAGAAADHSTLGLDRWRWLDLQSGVATIESATVDQFVPQMLNFELVGAVDFQKGCYPGQEVVARSQYRGTLKRRSFLFDIDAPASAGQEVFHSGDAAQPAGMVANAAPRPDGGGASALVEVKLAALGHGSLHLGAVDGPALRRTALPYEVALDAGAAA